jgi:hypothetical protein
MGFKTKEGQSTAPFLPRCRGNSCSVQPARHFEVAVLNSSNKRIFLFRDGKKGTAWLIHLRQFNIGK